MISPRSSALQLRRALMYSVSDYGRMIADSARREAYSEAMRRAITPESIVLDIGAGTGYFSVLACQMGARRVYALEPGNVFPLLKQVVAENHCAERVECMAELSTAITLPQRA